MIIKWGVRENAILFLVVILIILIILVHSTTLNPLVLFSGNLVLVSSQAPETINLGDNFKIKCDYGQAWLPCITAKHGNNYCSFSGWEGNAAVFNCTSAKVGLADNYCLLFNNPSDSRCTETQENKIQSTNVVDNANKVIDNANKNYDVIIVGAGTGGIAAAIQAARMGAKTGLIEETDWIGGQMAAAGVSSLDEAQFLRDYSSGIYKEFKEKVKAHYGSKPTNTCYFSDGKNCFEPSIAQKILSEMLNKEENIDLFLNKKITKVIAEGDNCEIIGECKVKGVIDKEGNIFNAKIVIDATEYGDIIALSPAKYRIGTSTSDNINLDSCVQDITWLGIIRKYNEIPEKLKINSIPPGYEEAKSIFEKYINITGREFLGPAPDYSTSYPWAWIFHNSFRGMPDSLGEDYQGWEYDKITKTGINQLAIDYPYSVKAIENLTERKKINCEAKLRTIQFLYYVQNELNESWSVALEESYDTDYNKANLCDNIPEEFKEIELMLPLMPYIRESRRIIGIYTLTYNDTLRDNNEYSRSIKEFKTSLAVGDYANDLHGCRISDDLDKIDNVWAIPWQQGPFQIPFESFIPEKIDGLLPAEKNLAYSRLANGATRLQGITMMTGQASGAIAAIAVKENIQPRQINPVLIQTELTNSKVILTKYSWEDIEKSSNLWNYAELLDVLGILEPYSYNQNLKIFSGNIKLTGEESKNLFEKSFGYSPNFSANPTRKEFIKQLTNALNLSSSNPLQSLKNKGLIDSEFDCNQYLCLIKRVSKKDAAYLLGKAIIYNIKQVQIQPQEKIIDNTDSAFSKVGSLWYSSKSISGYYGSDYFTSPKGTGNNIATWSLSGVASGKYEVYARWTSFSNRATNAPYTINHKQGSTTILANQQANGGNWNILGTYSLDSNSNIKLANNADNYIIADAIRLVPA